jgi:hypothetical protein
MPGLKGLDPVDAVREVAPHARIVHLAKPSAAAQLTATVQRANTLAQSSGETEEN